MDYNYIGHIISFITNWLTCSRAYISLYAYAINSVSSIKETINEVKIVCRNLSEKVKKSMEVDREKA